MAMALAKLKSSAEDSSFRDAMVESLWVGLLGGIAGYAGGALGDAAVGGQRNVPITILQNLFGIAVIAGSLIGFNNRYIVRYGIPFGGAFLTGANAYAVSIEAPATVSTLKQAVDAELHSMMAVVPSFH
jgi:hypothetical protein